MKKKCLSITKETFKEATPEVQSHLLYDCLNEIHGDVAGIKDSLQRRKIIDTTISGTTGLVGGFLAVFGINWFKEM
uniref:Uncharacterized protein n=1 Tax=viral metagenome TaxID=1070528 RepID=A0A6M3IHX3_9ZZZZ